MARMNGCNDHFEKMKKAQGKNTVTPGAFARNNMSKGGVNTDLGGGAKGGSGGSVKAGGAAQGKHHHMPKGK
jgi:hypothetical protein